MIKDIHKEIWMLSRHVQCRESHLELTRLTDELVRLYALQGRLTTDPFSPTRERTLSLPSDQILAVLKDSTCIVTGGLGCVGSTLIQELLKFNVKAIIILDNKNNEFNYSEKVISLQCDVRNLQTVQEIFALYRPDFVFHTAAQRDPGFAESHIVETVTTNVMGTANMVKACEAIGTVKQMVFSSTGKASRYFTEEVYAATKKLDEFILDTYARESDVKYSMVRFTHILDNSLMNAQLKEGSEKDDHLAVHSPGKYVTAQNAKEAAYLMLNALVYSEEKHCNFLLVRHLEWPVESLEMALYYIKQSGRNIPVIFLGNPVGYSEKFFRGQMDWSQPNELNLLTNVYERKYRMFNSDNDIIISRACSTDKATLERVLDRIGLAKGEAETKEALIEGLKEVVKESLKTVDQEETIDILRWGLDPRFLEMENVRISDFREIISLLVESLEGTEFHEEAKDLMYQKV